VILSAEVAQYLGYEGALVTGTPRNSQLRSCCPTAPDPSWWYGWCPRTRAGKRTEPGRRSSATDGRASGAQLNAGLRLCGVGRR
jgi:hypothetical protein